MSYFPEHQYVQGQHSLWCMMMALADGDLGVAAWWANISRELWG